LALWCAQATIAMAAKEKIRMGGSPFLISDAGFDGDHRLTEPLVDLVFVVSHRVRRVRRAAWL